MLPRAVRYPLAVVTFLLAAVLAVSFLLNVESIFFSSNGRVSPSTLGGWSVALAQATFVGGLALLSGWATLRLVNMRAR